MGKPKTSENEKDVKLDTAPAQSAESQKEKSKEETEKDKQEPAAVPEKVAEEKEEKADTPPKKSVEDNQKEKSSEPEKYIKTETAPDKFVTKTVAEEVGKQEPATISEKVADPKEDQTQTSPLKSGDDSKKPKTSQAEKEVKLDRAPSESSESQKDNSKG